MDTQKIYQLLREFIKTAGLNNKKFAGLAGINPNTFQTMVNRKSVPKADIISKIGNAMNAAIDQQENAEMETKLLSIQTAFLSECGLSSIDKNLNQRIIEIAKEASSAANMANILQGSVGTLVANMCCESADNMRALLDTPGNRAWSNCLASLASLNSETFNLRLLDSAEETPDKKTEILSRISAALDALNAEGQQEALKRIEELTFVPKYQKKDGE